MFLAKSSVPSDIPVFSHCKAIEQVADFPITFFAAPAGYLPAESLSAVLSSKQYPIVWLRVGPEDRDPATLLLSLIGACQGWAHECGTATRKHMQGQPGNLYGWPVLFQRLAQEYSVSFPQPFSIVLENVHHLDASGSALTLLISHFLNLLPERAIRVLISHTDFPARMTYQATHIFGICDLRVEEKPGHQPGMVSTANELMPMLERQSILLSQGRSEVVQGVLASCNEIGAQTVQMIMKQTRTVDQLLSELVRNCLQVADPDTWRALMLTLELGYFHAEAFRDVLGQVVTSNGPWLQNLSGGWQKIREVWRPALESILHRHLSSQRSMICQAAHQLAEMRAIEIAVPLFFRLGEHKQAARLIEENLERLMNDGQWQTVSDWLTQLPGNLITDLPHLLYGLGELQMLSNSVESAKHNFRRAGKMLVHQGNSRGACHSLLAESALALREGDEQLALLSAQDAYALTGDQSMSQERAWTNWQLGLLATLTRTPSVAKMWFENACQLTNDPYSRALFQQALGHTSDLENAILQQEYHRREAQLAEENTRRISQRLRDFLEFPPDTLSDLLRIYGWFGLPVNLKLPAQTAETGTLPVHPLSKIVCRLKAQAMRVFSWRNVSTLENTLSHLDLPAPMISGDTARERHKDETSHSPAVLESELGSVQGAQAISPQITIYCLGPLRVLNNRKSVSDWPSKKVQLVFKYLLLHRQSLAPKETIMEIFWPEADIESARRNLHQAIYNLRLILRGLDEDLHIIEFEQDGYRINPEINIWIDHEIFEQHYKAARQLENLGSIEQAIAEYTIAEQMYVDHLFSEDLYEEWIRAQREYLWQIYLSTATRLAEYHFQRKNYPLAISIGQRILQKDRCEETAHQILMQCFHNQGQRQLAIRQYEICRQALKEELDVEPSSKTHQLFTELVND